MHHRCKSWRMPIHAHKGNSLWARIDNFVKNFVIVRAHLRMYFFDLRSKTNDGARRGNYCFKTLQTVLKCAIMNGEKSVISQRAYEGSEHGESEEYDSMGVKHSVKYQVYSESQWVYPDDVLGTLNEALLTLHVARGGNVLCQILTDLSVREGDAFSFSLEGANGVLVTSYQLVSVTIPHNSAPQGKPNSTDDYESVKDFVTRKAPFEVYDVTAPMEKVFARGGRLGFALRFQAAPEAVPGVQSIVVTLETEQGRVEIPVTLTVHKATVPPMRDSKLMVINWVHPRRIASDLGCERYSEEYYKAYGKMLTHLVDIRNNHLSLAESWRREVPDESVKDEQGRIVDFDLSTLERSLQMAEQAGMTKLYGMYVAHFERWNQPEIYLLWDWENRHPATDVEAYRQLKIYFKRVREMVERNGWQDKYIQPLFDEPQFQNADNYRIFVGMVRSIYPELLIHDPVEVDNIPGTADILCVKNAIYEKYKESFQIQQKNGQRMTWYACGAPAGYTMNRSIDLPLIVSRLCFWICHRYNFEGFLHWGYHVDYKTASIHAPGNTQIVYFVDGDYWDSIRAHVQRAGAEDWELLSIIKERDPQTADLLVERACRTFDDYERDFRVFDELKLAVLEEADKYFD